MEEKLKIIIEKCVAILDAESIKEVWHFYDHGEYEMALEGLLIELTTARKYPSNYDFNQLNELVLYYDLKNEAVFDVNIWEKYICWSKQNNAYGIQDAGSAGEPQ